MNDHHLGHHSNDAKDRENAAFMDLEEARTARNLAALQAAFPGHPPETMREHAYWTQGSTAQVVAAYQAFIARMSKLRLGRYLRGEPLTKRRSTRIRYV